MFKMRVVVGLLTTLLLGLAKGDCGNGVAGIVSGNSCCAESCVTCGGVGCSDREGGATSCCTAAIEGSGVLCETTSEGPCRLSSTVLAPATLSTLESISPTPVPTIPDSCTEANPSFRWNPDTGLNGRLYAEGDGGGCFTISDLYAWQGFYNNGNSKGPVFVLDSNDRVDETATTTTGKWLLTADLFVTGGATFYCRGKGVGGNCAELRIRSTSGTDFFEIRGHGGNLYFEDTIVTSWDVDGRKPQETYKDGRSYIRCVSEVLTGQATCAKGNMGECRMDIIDSEMGYLGYAASEAYGITWKVRGFCSDLSNPDVFDDVNVYGDMKGSDIHHMYYGMYSYGHLGGVWTNNLMHDNHQYGFDPHDDSDYLIIAGNKVYNNVNHGIIASKRCNNVQIYNNEVYDGGADAVGIFLHRSGDDSQIYGNTITNMGDAGIALLETSRCDIHDNQVDGGEFGIRVHLGSSNNKVYDNVFKNIWNVGMFTYFGSDEPWVDDGRPFDNDFYDNTIQATETGVKIKDSDNIVIQNNAFSGTTEIEFNDAIDTVWTGNTIPVNTCLKNIDGSSTFTASSVLPVEC
ncbi:unnamed protein product [Ectocarpus fasciculatus]